MPSETVKGTGRARRPPLLFLAVLLLGAGFVIGISIGWDKASRAYASYFQPAPGGAPLPEMRGRVFLDNDAYYWIAYAREMARTGAWRIRHTAIDNLPFGRPVHWSQAVSWLLLGAGRLRHAITGEPMEQAIENGALWVGPALWVVLLLLMGGLAYRRLGAVPAGLLVLSLAGMQSLQAVYHPLRPDHHGLHIAFMLGSLVCLVLGGLGWVSSVAPQPREPRLFRSLELPGPGAARGYFMASGVLGGMGLWTGATVQILGIGLIAAGALMLVFFMPSRLKQDEDAGTAYLPELWRLWALTGAATSLAFYVLEYFPMFPGMRLEVNHPLYALTWFCMGDIVARVSGRKSESARRGGKGAWILLIAGASLLPLLLLFGPVDWHYLREAWSWRMSSFIQETRPMKAFPEHGLLATLFLHFGLLPLFLLAAPALTGPRHTRLYEWAALWMSFLPPFVFLVASVLQVRWMAMFGASVIWLMAASWPVAWRMSQDRSVARSWLYAGAAVLALQALVMAGLQVKEVMDIARGRVIHDGLARGQLHRLFAARLAALNTDGRFRILTEPDLAGPLYHFGGFSAVESFYWENRDGMIAATAFFSDPGDDEARAVARERGLTHVILPHSAQMAHLFFFLREGRFSEEGARATLAGRLVAQPGELPTWIQKDQAMTRQAKAEYRFQGVPVFSSMDVFRIDPAKL